MCHYIALKGGYMGLYGQKMLVNPKVGYNPGGTICQTYGPSFHIFPYGPYIGLYGHIRKITFSDMSPA